MIKYYTNVAMVGNNILYRGVKDGRRVKMKIGYTPTLFLPAKKETKFKKDSNNTDPDKGPIVLGLGKKRLSKALKQLLKKHNFT